MYNSKTPYHPQNPSFYHTNFIPPKGYTNWYTEDLQFRVSDHHTQQSRRSPGKSPSPENRTQVIARARCELMEIVKSMPESSYELSLKDMVVHHEEETRAKAHPPEEKIVRVSTKNEKVVVRNGRYENKGVLLNMGFPRVSSKNERSNKFAGRYGSGMQVWRKNEGVKSCEEDDWWKKTFAGSSGSGGGSTRSTGRSCSCSSSGSTGKSIGSNTSCRSCSTRKSSSSNTTGRSRNIERKRRVSRPGCWIMFPFQRKHSS